MTMHRGRNFNTNDVAAVTSVDLNSTTATKIADVNADRLTFHVNSNDENNAVWIKLQAASVDNDKKGIFLARNIAAAGPGRSLYDMPTDNVYTGEISAISEAGTPTVYITEY